MIQVQETYQKIITSIQRRGPSLPVQIAKEVNMSSLFISAFLAELVGNKRVRVSNLKVGGSPLYYIEGQEEKLEQFYNYMHPKEGEAFLLLRKNKILKDSDQAPAIRVALRSIKDFSAPLSVENELYWRYLFIPELEARAMIIAISREKYIQEEKSIEVRETEPVVEIQEITREEKIVVHEPLQLKTEIKSVLQQEKKKSSEKEITPQTFENPLVIKEKEKKIKVKPKSVFALKAIGFLEKNNFSIVEEKEWKAKEFTCVVAIESQLGTLHFYTQAKDKKSISEDDLKYLLSESQKIPLPAFLLHTGEISKKAEAYVKTYAAILKVKKIG
ncbi:MAG: hypothetical protein RL557_60 [archaeon]|jgi:hypothetical protein